MGMVIVSPDKITIKKSLRLGFSATNNKAEYKALLIGVAMFQKMGGKDVEVFLDSRLIVRQVKGEMEARDLRMQGYLNQAQHLQFGFELFTIQQILRSSNTHTNSLATLATSSGQDLGLYLSRIYISPLKRRRRKSQCTRSRSGLVGWILLFYFSRKVLA